MEIFVPLVLESSVTSKITARRRTSFQKAWLGVQTSFPPLRFKFVKLISGVSPSILNRFSRFQRRCVLLENVFPTTYNMTQYVQGIPRKKIGKQKNGKFRFSSPRIDMGTEIAPLESYELTVFSRICTKTFGALLKFHHFILPPLL